MCKVLWTVNRLMLGGRELGFEMFDGKGVVEMTRNQIEKALKSGSPKVVGLRLTAEKSLLADTENAFYSNIMEHRHIGSYKPVMEDSGAMVNNFFYIIGSKEDGGETEYEFVTTRFEHGFLRSEMLLSIWEVGLVAGGMRVADGKIELADLEKIGRPVEEGGTRIHDEDETAGKNDDADGASEFGGVEEKGDADPNEGRPDQEEGVVSESEEEQAGENGEAEPVESGLEPEMGEAESEIGEQEEEEAAKVKKSQQTQKRRGRKKKTE